MIESFSRVADMKNPITTIAAILCLILASSSSEARGPYGSINIGNWHGGAYTDDKSGAFSHCAAAASYQSGILFLVSVGQDFSWTLGFFHQNWKLTPGEAFALALTFDGQAAINVQGMPIGTTLVSVGMPANSALINQFRKAKVMTAFAQGQLLQFNLTQTAELPRSSIASPASRKTGSPVPASLRFRSRSQSRRPRPHRGNRVLRPRSPAGLSANPVPVSSSAAMGTWSPISM